MAFIYLFKATDSHLLSFEKAVRMVLGGLIADYTNLSIPELSIRTDSSKLTRQSQKSSYNEQNNF